MIEKRDGFSFKMKGTEYAISWDSVQYLLTRTVGKKKETSYYPSIHALLNALMSIVPKTSVAGTMHEFTEDINGSMAQIKLLGRYIERTFAPLQPFEQNTKWAKEQREKSDG